jgi:hypothetical protein
MEVNEDLRHARSQLSYWTERVRELEKTDADRRREATAREFMSMHTVVLRSPANTIPIRMSVDGEEMNEQTFIHNCGIWHVCAGTLHDLAMEQ